MIKTAQDSYLEGRQAAMEKLAESESLPSISAPDFFRRRVTNQVVMQGPAYLANYYGAKAAREAGNPNAEMTWHGYSRPGVYALSGLLGGGLLGYGLGKAYDSYSRPPDEYIDYNPGVRGATVGAALAGLGGYGYGLRRAYQIPGEM